MGKKHKSVFVSTNSYSGHPYSIKIEIGTQVLDEIHLLILNYSFLTLDN